MISKAPFQISDCLHLKANTKKIIYLYVSPTTQKWVSWITAVPTLLRIFSRIFLKSEMALMWNSLEKKNLKRKISLHCPFKWAQLSSPVRVANDSMESRPRKEKIQHDLSSQIAGLKLNTKFFISQKMQPTAVFLEQTQADQNLVVKMYLHVVCKFTHTLCPHVFWIFKELIQAEH